MVRTTSLKNYSDTHYTQPWVAKAIVEHFKPQGKILEPFRGSGVFYDQLPNGTDWCEIEEGYDFFDYHTSVDWIVTNPPFSNLTDIMKHCFDISRHTVLLVPLSKIYSSTPRVNLMLNKAGLREELHFGSGRSIGFDIGFPFAAMHFEVGYSGPTKKTQYKV